MKHFSNDYKLASAFSFQDKVLVRFFSPGCSCDVIVDCNLNSAYSKALQKEYAVIYDFNFSEFAKTQWQLCDKILNKEDFEFLGIKFKFSRIDYYTFLVSSKYGTLFLDHYDHQFMVKIIDYSYNILMTCGDYGSSV